MPSTTAAGPPAAGRPDAGPAPVPREGINDPAALLQGQRAAECELADALARFQSEVTPATELSLPAVVEAARGAFRLGFAYTSCRGLDEDGQPLLEVTVMHRGGDQLSSQVRLTAEEGEQEFDAAARLLAQLLGIPVLSAAQLAQQSKAEPGVTAVAPVTEPASQQAAAPAAAPVDTIGPGSPDAPGTEESLCPLGEQERELLLEMIRSLRPVEARRQFQIAFRHHFNVPKEARSIAGFITQKRHKDFVDRFERELADLPPAAAEANAAQAEASA
jgi:hypothetical protein